MSQVVQLWRAELARTNEKAGQSLADPADYPNLFSGLTDALKAEQFLTAERGRRLPAAAAAGIPMNHERSPIEEMKAAEAAGTFRYVPEAEAAAAVEADEGDGGPPHRVGGVGSDTAVAVAVAAAADPQPASAPPPAAAPVQQKHDPLLDEDDLDIDIDNLNLDDNSTENLDVTIDEDEFLTD